jgi:hypothetical protein
MYQPIQPKTTTPSIRKSMSRERLLAVVLIPLVLVWFVLSPRAQAQLSPAPDGGYLNRNTAEGEDSLFNLTTGNGNTAVGYHTLHNNDTGDFNIAVGNLALVANVNGGANTAIGTSAMDNNIDGNGNTAIGLQALAFNISGVFNTGVGFFALQNTTGSNNTALGIRAGDNLTNGFRNIDIGNEGVAADSNTIRIGDSNQSATFIAGINGVPVADGAAVIIDGNDQLGTASAGSLQVTGQIIELVQGTPAPAGFTLIGTETIAYRDTSNKQRTVTVSLYRKN